VLVFSIIALAAGLVIGRSLKHQAPGFISRNEIIALSLWCSIMVMLFLRKKTIMGGVILLALFSIFSGYHVNPLYKGFGSYENNPVATKIRQSQGPWVVVSS